MKSNLWTLSAQVLGKTRSVWKMTIIFSGLPGNNLTGKGGRGRLHRRKTVPKELHGTTKFPRPPCVGSLCCSVTKSHLTLWPHGLHYSRIPCPSLSPRVCSNSCPLSRWCYLPSHPLPPSSLFAFNLSQHQGLFQWVSSSHQVAKELELQSASASVLPMNIQDLFPLEWTGWISLQSKGLSRVFSNTTIWKHQFFNAEPSLWSHTHIRMWLLEKP